MTAYEEQQSDTQKLQLQAIEWVENSKIAI